MKIVWMTREKASWWERYNVLEQNVEDYQRVISRAVGEIDEFYRKMKRDGLKREHYDNSDASAPLAALDTIRAMLVPSSGIPAEVIDIGELQLYELLKGCIADPP